METTHKTREQWLTTAVEILDAEVFAPHLPKSDDTDESNVPFRVSCGWPGGPGKKKGVLGQCWNPKSSADGTTEMFITPTEKGEISVLDTLVHENVHRHVGTECGHKGEFRRLALAVGLTGKMTSTEAGPELREKLVDLAERLGYYPHDRLDTSTKKKQTTRMIKLTCSECDNIARQSRMAYLTYGLICGQCETKMLEDV